VSGWEQPTPPSESPPSSHWTQPSDTPGPGQLIRRAWRLYRSTPRHLLLVAAIPELVRDLLAIPSLLIGGLAIQGIFEVMGDFLARVAADPQAYRYGDSRALQAELQAQFQAAMLPQADLAVWSALGGGAGIAVGLIGSSVLTAAALAAAAGRPISVAGAFRLVAARGGLLKPTIALGVGWVAVSWSAIVVGASTGFQAWAGAPGSPRSVLLASLFAVMALVGTLGFIVLAVRWALYVPTSLAEGLGIGPGLTRAARLSRGIRTRLALAMAGVLILDALSVGIVATVVGLVLGFSAGSVAVGIAAYLIAAFIGNLLWAPLLPAIVALAYQERAGDVEASATVASL
jgi:hypothetical protein